MNQNIPIFVASSDEYTVYLAPLLVSILENTDSVIDFYIIDGGITTYKRRQLERLVKERRAGGV